MNDLTTADLSQRCADGALTDAQRADLLARLEADPAGYRPLALALLERRVIDAALRDSLRPAAAPASSGSPTVAPFAAARRWRRAAGWAVSAAAGLAVGLGWNPTAAPPMGPAPGEPSAFVADTADADRTVPDAPPASVPAGPEAPKSPLTPVARVEWATASGTPFSLPVYDERDVPAGLAARAADPLLDDLRDELILAGRFGGEIRQEYTVPLSDGRLLTVPVHAVSVREPEVF